MTVGERYRLELEKVMWTTARPTEPGYWWLREPMGETVMVEVYARNAKSRPDHLSVHYVACEDHRPVAEMGGDCLWCGPVEPPAG